MTILRKRRGGRPFSRQALELWLESPRGRQLLQQEALELRRVLPEVFGRHVLQVGSWGRDGQLLRASEILHSAVIGTTPGLGEQAVADPENLPVLSRSVDAVILAHTLEFAGTPQSVLRETNRILSDRGRLFVLGFSPWGGWGLRQWLGLRYPDFPSGAKFHGAGRLCDWLELLDFEVLEVRRYGVGFPWTASRSDGDPFDLGRLLQPLAEAYLLVARKRVIPVNLIGRTQRAQVRPLIGMPAGEARRTPASAFEETRT
ncbi:MAG: class I SAM-dependent methyltransferase [Stenotrophobium sp.]